MGTSERPRESDAAAATRLRAAIDGGRTGDKVRAPDPAAAPLGTDDEAAGQTPTAPASRGARPLDRPSRRPLPWLVIGAMAATILAVLAAVRFGT